MKQEVGNVFLILALTGVWVPQRQGPKTLIFVQVKNCGSIDAANMHRIFGHFDLVSISVVHCDFFVLLAVLVNIQRVQSRVFVFSVSCKCGLKKWWMVPLSKLFCGDGEKQRVWGFCISVCGELEKVCPITLFACQSRCTVFESLIFELLVLSGENLARTN